MIAIILGIILFLIIASVTIHLLGCVVGIFNRDLNSDQRFKAGLYVVLFFLVAIIGKSCQFMNESDRLEEKRLAVWRQNIPHGYYDSESPNFGRDELINERAIEQMNKKIEEQEYEMSKPIIYLILLFPLLVIIGFIANATIQFKE